jgi:hypothetical protein
MDAETARASIKSLTTGIELPKTVTKEQRDLEASANLKKRVETTAPFKADFITFDKFKRGNIDFDVPAPVETKNRLSAMFDAMFIESGMEPTPENLQTAKDMRDGQFLLDNFEKIIEIEVKKGQTEIQKKLDEALHNTQPPNTKTATDEGNVKSDLPGPGLSKFLEDNGR